MSQHLFLSALWENFSSQGLTVTCNANSRGLEALQKHSAALLLLAHIFFFLSFLSPFPFSPPSLLSSLPPSLLPFLLIFDL